jgi:hypothetical protein
MNILSIDVGFSSIKFAYSNAEGVTRVGKIVSAIAKFDNNAYGNPDCIEYGGSYYYVGELAVKSPTESLVQLNTYEDLRDVYPVIIKYIVQSLKSIGIEPDRLVIGLSIAHLEKSSELIDWVSRECNISADLISVYPQGISSKYTIYKHGLDPDSNADTGKYTNYIGVDIGFNTVDVYNVINNQCNISSTYGFKDSGIVYICSQVSQKLKEGGVNMSIQDLKEYIEVGQFQYRGKIIQISNLVNELIAPYTINLIHAIENQSKSAIDKTERIILTGGGANLVNRVMLQDDFRSEISKLYGSDFIVIPKRPELYNVLGYKIAQEYRLSNES